MSDAPSSPASEERSALLSAWADGLLSPAQEQRLVELLRTEASFRRDYVRMCRLTTQLMWAASASQPVLRLPAVGTGVPARGPAGAAPLRRWLSPLRVSLVGMVLLVALGLAWRFLPPSGTTSPDVLASVSGTVSVVRGDQPPMPLRAADVATAPLPLKVGDRIQTDHAGSATLLLSDRTRILLGPESSMTLAARPEARVIVSHGLVTAQVAPQSAQAPMIFVTPRASVRVLGTELELMVQEARTEVAVTEGKVRVTRPSDGASADVSAGQFLPVEERGALAVVDWPATPSVWSEDFESGVPTGWTGRLVRDGLPTSSRGALQGVAVPGAPGLQMVAGSPVVERGLFAWHADSVLHVTFRVQPPSWFHICLFARTYSRGKPLVAWCHVDPELWQVQAGEWRTVGIPLSQFHWTGSVQPETTLGRIPLRVAFMGPGDLPGVVIDSLRVDRGGTGASRVSDPAPGGNP